MAIILHTIYQLEAKRQTGTGEDTVRHPDDYFELPKHTKEYDRVLARYILSREARREKIIQNLRISEDENTSNAKNQIDFLVNALRRLYEAVLKTNTVGQLRAAEGHPDNANERELIDAILCAEYYLGIDGWGADRGEQW